eukprot:scaffold59477_cov61-Phaeocystis_antarctica.AAC.1
MFRRPLLWRFPTALSPPRSVPSPRGTAVRSPRSAPSFLALNRGCSTPGARRASGRWLRGRPCLLCVSRF